MLVSICGSGALGTVGNDNRICFVGIIVCELSGSAEHLFQKAR